MRSKMWKRNLAVLTALGMVSGAGMPGTWMKPVTANAESGAECNLGLHLFW